MARSGSLSWSSSSRPQAEDPPPDRKLSTGTQVAMSALEASPAGQVAQVIRQRRRGTTAVLGCAESPLAKPRMQRLAVARETPTVETRTHHSQQRRSLRAESADQLQNHNQTMPTAQPGQWRREGCDSFGSILPLGQQWGASSVLNRPNSTYVRQGRDCACLQSIGRQVRTLALPLWTAPRPLLLSSVRARDQEDFIASRGPSCPDHVTAARAHLALINDVLRLR